MYTLFNISLAKCKWEDHWIENTIFLLRGINNCSVFIYIFFSYSWLSKPFKLTTVTMVSWCVTHLVYHFLFILWINHRRKKFHWNLSLHNHCSEFLKALIFFLLTPQRLSKVLGYHSSSRKTPHFYLLKTLSFAAYGEQNLTASEINLLPIQTLEESKQS